MSVGKLSTPGKSSLAPWESATGAHVRAVPKWLFAEAVSAALVTLAVNMKLMTWLATDRVAK